jgi:hypothetical protein
LAGPIFTLSRIRISFFIAVIIRIPGRTDFYSWQDKNIFFTAAIIRIPGWIKYRFLLLAG